MKRLLISILLSAVLAVAGVLPAAAESADRDKPMNAEADALRYDDLKQSSVFTGNVVITKGTIVKDLERAIDLLKSLATEEERERAAVYMDGLAQMRSEWSQAQRGGVSPSRTTSSRTGSPSPSSAPRGGGPPARSGRTPASSRRTR